MRINTKNIFSILAISLLFIGLSSTKAYSISDLSSTIQSSLRSNSILAGGIFNLTQSASLLSSIQTNLNTFLASPLTNLSCGGIFNTIPKGCQLDEQPAILCSQSIWNKVSSCYKGNTCSNLNSKTTTLDLFPSANPANCAGWTYTQGFSNYQCQENKFVGRYYYGAVMASEFCNVPSHCSIDMSFNLALFDQWQNNNFTVMADTKMVYLQSFTNNLKTCKDVCAEYNYGDSFTTVNITFSHNSSSLQLMMISDLPCSNAHASWGIADLHIVFNPCKSVVPNNTNNNTGTPNNTKNNTGTPNNTNNNTGTPNNTNNNTKPNNTNNNTGTPNNTNNNTKPNNTGTPNNTNNDNNTGHFSSNHTNSTACNCKCQEHKSCHCCPKTVNSYTNITYNYTYIAADNQSNPALPADPQAPFHLANQLSGKRNFRGLAGRL